MNKNILPKIILVFLLALLAWAEGAMGQNENMEQFRSLEKNSWKEVFHDSCTGDWQDQWFLDGERAVVKSNKKGMYFSGGPIQSDFSCHAVLWTKESFSGAIKIEYEYTRMDCEKEGGVNILYILASGIDEEPYVKDIAEWSELREIPFMSAYLRNMRLLHISYASFGSDAPQGQDYLRARHYPVKPGGPLNQFEPTYFDTGLFKTGATYKITVIRKEDDLFMHVEYLYGGAILASYFNPETDKISRLFHWDISESQAVNEGRVGLRHMATRASRYKNFRISVIKKTKH
jgi:hypothetical protein